jgi:hypothetical protein
MIVMTASTIFRMMVMGVHGLGRDPEPRTRRVSLAAELERNCNTPREGQSYGVLPGARRGHAPRLGEGLTAALTQL